MTEDQIISLVKLTGLADCIDDAYLERGDWVPLILAFTDAVLLEVNKELVQPRATVSWHKLQQGAAATKQYGCYIDLEYAPDECVFDTQLIEHCMYARQLDAEGKGKHDCEHWKPIAIVKRGQQ